MTRALIVTRLSRVTEATTSPERQREACERICVDRGWDVVGVAEDLDVSGSVSPFDRPKLRAWLERPHEYDAVVVYRMDRLTRSLADLVRIIEWADENGISLVSATEPFDSSTPVGSMIPKITAMVAELELDAISARNADAFDKNIRKGRYRGGNPPLGYRAARVDGEWRYVPDEMLAPLTRTIVARVIEGEPIASIVRDLNDREVPSPRDHHRIAAGKEPQSSRWAVSNLIRQLESPTLLGYAMRSEPVRKNGKAVKKKGVSGNSRKLYGPKEVIYGPDGSPVVRSEPIITLTDFQKLQDALKVRRGTSPKRRKNPTALLLQVIFCGVCGRPMYRLANNKPSQYYRCASAAYKSTCGNRSVRLDEMDKAVSALILSVVGAKPHVVRVFEPGSDNADELAEVNAELDSLAAAVGRFKGTQLESVLGQVDVLTARKELLESQPHEPAGYRYEPTGKTFAEHWGSLDQTGRNQWLRDHGVRLDFTHPRDSGRKIDITFGDVPAMFAAVDPNIAGALDRFGEEFRAAVDQSVRQALAHRSG